MSPLTTGWIHREDGPGGFHKRRWTVSEDGESWSTVEWLESGEGGEKCKFTSEARRLL